MEIWMGREGGDYRFCALIIRQGEVDYCSELRLWMGVSLSSMQCFSNTSLVVVMVD